MSMDYSESPGVTPNIKSRKIIKDDNLISDRINQNFKAGGNEGSIETLSLKDR